MKNNRQKKNLIKPEFEDKDVLKVKKRNNSDDEKVNIKSRKFWDEIYEDDEDTFEKLLR